MTNHSAVLKLLHMDRTGTEKEREKFTGALLQPFVTNMPKTRLTELSTRILKTSGNKVHSFSLMKEKISVHQYNFCRTVSCHTYLVSMKRDVITHTEVTS